MKDMARADIEAVIVRELRVISHGSVEVTAETNIARDLGLNSMAVMDLVMALEDRFDISIPIDQIAQTESVGQLSDLIRSLQEEAKS